jgi:hypothetical protein
MAIFGILVLRSGMMWEGMLMGYVTSHSRIEAAKILRVRYHHNRSIQVAQTLKPGGKWLYITWRQPHFIKPLLLRPDIWEIKSEVLENPEGVEGGGMFEYFGYVITKNQVR